jgi:hypothetical protein
MADEFELKPIHEDAVAEAIHKAEHYRLLNEPSQAESICRDVLHLRPDDQKALVVLVLALTDQFGHHGRSPGPHAAREFAAKLTSGYERAYYTGLVCERQARALLSRGLAGSFAYDGFREAMDWYEKAEALRPAGNDDAILRWNSCVRSIRRNTLEPRMDDTEHPLE